MEGIREQRDQQVCSAVLLLAINVNSAHKIHTHGKHEATLNLDSRTYAASCQCSHRPSHV